MSIIAFARRRSDVVSTIADQGIASVNNFLVGMIIGRTSSKHDLGVYMLGYTLLISLSTAQNSLIGTPYTVRLPLFKHRTSGLFTGSMIIHQIGFAIVCCCCFALAALADSRDRVLLATLSATLPFLLAKELARKAFMANLRPLRALALDSCICVVQTLGLLTLGRFHMLTPEAAFQLASGVAAVVLLSFAWRYRRGIQLNVSLAFAHWKPNWKLGRWVFVSALLWSGSVSCCPWLLSVLRGTEDAGSWAACIGVVAFVNPILLGLQSYIEPRVSRSYADGGVAKMSRTINRFAIASSCFVFLFAVVAFTLGDSLPALIYGPKYAGYRAIIGLLSLANVVWAAGYPFSCGLNTIGQPFSDSIINSVYPLIVFGVGIPLTRSYSLLGTATALLLAYAVAALGRKLTFAAMSRRLPVLDLASVA